MDTSLFLARLIGPMLLIIGAGVLLNRENFRAMAKELVASREQMFIIGLLTLLGGLAIVNTYNVWQGWPMIITIFGWIFAISGALRILVPDFVRDPKYGAGQALAAGHRRRRAGRRRCLAVLPGLYRLNGASTCVGVRAGAHCRRSEGRRGTG